MAWNDSYINRITNLIKKPSNFRKILPFIESRYLWYKRKLLEKLGNDKLSKPYPGHNKLISYINKEGGFFVVCGGNDGYFQDPTYYLERIKKWRGIIIEPTDIAYLCRLNRPASTIYQYAVVSPEYKNSTITMIDVNAMSIIKDSLTNSDEWITSGENAQNIKSKQIIVQARTVQSIIDEYTKKTDIKKIDLFVADIEGYEINALKGLDFSKNSPTYILIESHTQKKLSEINSYLINKNYKLVEEIYPKDYLYKINND